MKLPRPIQKLIESFERLPGIGPKSAQRLTFYLLHFPKHEIEAFSSALLGIKDGVKLCEICKNVSENAICSVCEDDTRDKNILAVVSGPMDVIALERAGFKGLYHVLHGVIDPLNNIGPEDIFIENLKSRLENRVTSDSKIELILATNTSMEGETTALYIQKILREAGLDDTHLAITRIARGLPVGGDIEYADDVTLSRALEGRSAY